MKPIILFDLDGTLIDSTEAIVESFRYSFLQHNRDIPKEELILSKIGYTLEDIFLHLGVEESIVDSFVLAYKESYRKVSKPKTNLLEGAREAIESAYSFARLGVVTTKTARYSRELLEHMEVMHFFEVLVGREDVEFVKPHPEPIFKALERIDKKAVSKEQTWMIGDTLLDVNAAKNAGIKHIALMTGYGDKNELKSLSDLVLNDVLEAVDFIKKINK